jgi:hypothetical protein
VKVEFHAFLTSVLNEVEEIASRSGHFTPGTQWIRDWVGLRTDLVVVTRNDDKKDS